MNLFESIDSLLKVDIVGRELGLLVGLAKLFFDILLSTSSEWGEGGTLTALAR